MTRGDTKITSFDEAVNLAAATDSRKTARTSTARLRSRAAAMGQVKGVKLGSSAPV